ncbi:MAG: hypothetical protein WAX07_07110 [Candidatus Altiarchaeia archaeon]
MDAGFILGIGLAALVTVSVAYRTYVGGHTGADNLETGRPQNSGKKDQKESPEAQDKEIKQTDPRDVYHSKACLLLKLLEKVKKTEGVREVSLAEINSLSSQIEEIKKGLEGAGTKYDLRESEVRMAYASSRIEWLIKSYPRLRNDADTSAVIEEIRRINRRINNLEEV